jgi:hypothetical protein
LETQSQFGDGQVGGFENFFAVQRVVSRVSWSLLIGWYIWSVVRVLAIVEFGEEKGAGLSGAYNCATADRADQGGVAAGVVSMVRTFRL